MANISRADVKQALADRILWMVVIALGLAAGAPAMAIPPVVAEDGGNLAGQEVTATTATATPATDQAASGASSLLGEVVVTATRREEALQKVPVSVTAFTQ